MISGQIIIDKTARYYLSGPLDGNYKSVCFALHGYGQLANYFCKKLEDPELSETLFICPEGLHRFYLKDSSGRVGASWMTKEERLSDIKDYCTYLDQLFEHFSGPISKVKKVGILGFSQGVATACRWLANSTNSFDYLINWAGAFPPDLDFQTALTKIKAIPIWMVLGDEDEYINDEKLREHLNSLEERNFKPKVQRFKGGHRIETQTLKMLLTTI